MRIVIANWKMNLLLAEAEAFCEAFLRGFEPVEGVRVGIAPPFTLLRPVQERLGRKGVRVYGQNAHWEPKGAFTGELSMAQLLDAGCGGVLLGHSERRQLFGETDEALVRKLPAAWAKGLMPVFCIGETLAEREEGRTLEVLRQQLSILAQTGAGPLVIAYEPVWAIGTGRRAEAAQIAEVHGFIRRELQALLSEPGAGVPILYGGSVSPENFEEILSVPEVAGGLVGGASLDPDKFLRLVQQARKA